MPQPERSGRFQEAVLWPHSGVYDYQGQPTVLVPVSLRVRWEEKRSEALDPKGNTIIVDSTAMVDRRIDIGSLMWLGCSDELLAGANPPVYNWGSLVEVKTYNEIPDVRNRERLRTVGLMRWKDSPTPDVQMSTSVSVASSGTVAHGSPVTLTATVVGILPQGSVEFYDGEDIIGRYDNMVNGKCSIQTSVLGPGSHSIWVRYVGDQHNLPSESESIVQVIT